MFSAPSSSREMPRRTVRTFGLCQGRNTTSTPAIAVRKARDRIIHRMPMPKRLASIALRILNSASARIAIPMAIKVNVIVSKGFSKAVISKTVGMIPSRPNTKLGNALNIWKSACFRAFPQFRASPHKSNMHLIIQTVCATGVLLGGSLYFYQVNTFSKNHVIWVSMLSIVFWTWFCVKTDRVK